MMVDLKPCPFCGRPASIKKKKTYRRSCCVGEEVLPENAEIVDTRIMEDGRTLYTYYRKGFLVGCNTRNCCGRPGRYHSSEEAAAAAWNRRDGKWI